MSTYEQKYDDALLNTAWLSKADEDGTTWLMKYTSHPERAGYIFLATDLERVLFEVITASSIPSRLMEISRDDPDTKQDVDVSDIVGTSERVFKDLGDVLGGAQWGDVEVEMGEHDYFDAVMKLQCEGIKWSFNCTELKSRIPLSIIARHLIAPISNLVLQNRGLNSSPAFELPAVVVARAIEAGVGDEILSLDVKVDGRGEVSPGKNQNAKGGSSNTASKHSSGRSGHKPSNSNHETISAPSPSEQDHSDKADEAEDEDGGIGQTSRARKYPPTRRIIEDTPSESPAPEKQETTRPAQHRAKSHSDSANDEVDAPKASGQTMASQRSKRDREAEEEEALEKRREEMRRKMQGGGGGGRLGKRRGVR